MFSSFELESWRSFIVELFSGKLCLYSEWFTSKKEFVMIIFYWLNSVFLWTKSKFDIGSINSNWAKSIKAEWSWNIATLESS